MQKTVPVRLRMGCGTDDLDTLTVSPVGDVLIGRMLRTLVRDAVKDLMETFVNQADTLDEISDGESYGNQYFNAVHCCVDSLA